MVIYGEERKKKVLGNPLQSSAQDNASAAVGKELNAGQEARRGLAQKTGRVLGQATKFATEPHLADPNQPVNIYAEGSPTQKVQSRMSQGPGGVPAVPKIASEIWQGAKEGFTGKTIGPTAEQVNARKLGNPMSAANLDRAADNVPRSYVPRPAPGAPQGRQLGKPQLLGNDFYADRLRKNNQAIQDRISNLRPGEPAPPNLTGSHEIDGPAAREYRERLDGWKKENGLPTSSDFNKVLMNDFDRFTQENGGRTLGKPFVSEVINGNRVDRVKMRDGLGRPGGGTSTFVDQNGKTHTNIETPFINGIQRVSAGTPNIEAMPSLTKNAALNAQMIAANQAKNATSIAAFEAGDKAYSGLNGELPLKQAQTSLASANAADVPVTSRRLGIAAGLDAEAKGMEIGRAKRIDDLYTSYLSNPDPLKKKAAEDQLIALGVIKREKATWKPHVITRPSKDGKGFEEVEVLLNELGEIRPMPSLPYPAERQEEPSLLSRVARRLGY